MNLSISY